MRVVSSVPLLTLLSVLLLLTAVAAAAQTDDAEASAPEPIIIWGSYPVAPGQTVLLAGLNFPAQSEVRIKGVNSGSTASARAIAEQSSTHSLKFILPQSLPQDVFEISVGGSAAYFLNAPDVWSVHGDLGNTSTPGGSVRLLGRGLAAAQGRADLLQSAGGDDHAVTLARQLAKTVEDKKAVGGKYRPVAWRARSSACSSGLMLPANRLRVGRQRCDWSRRHTGEEPLLP